MGSSASCIWSWKGCRQKTGHFDPFCNSWPSITPSQQKSKKQHWSLGISIPGSEWNHFSCHIKGLLRPHFFLLQAQFPWLYKRPAIVPLFGGSNIYQSICNTHYSIYIYTLHKSPPCLQVEFQFWCSNFCWWHLTSMAMPIPAPLSGMLRFKRCHLLGAATFGGLCQQGAVLAWELQCTWVNSTSWNSIL